jgi:hypothetical protein
MWEVPGSNPGLGRIFFIFFCSFALFCFAGEDAWVKYVGGARFSTYSDRWYDQRYVLPPLVEET